MQFSRDYLLPHLQNSRVRQFLDGISAAEGTQEHGYGTMFGGSKFDDFSQHPNTPIPFTDLNGKENLSTAAGKYQILNPTWESISDRIGLEDFSPENQDLAAMYLLAEQGALQDVIDGNFESAIDKTGKIWASFPNSPYAQNTRSPEFMESAFGYGQSESPMNTSLPNTLAAIKNSKSALSDLMQTAEYDDESIKALTANRQKVASMLPMAMASLLSGDKGFQQLGSQLYGEAMNARKPMNIGDDLIFNPLNGKTAVNPQGAVKRNNSLLPTAVSMAQSQQQNALTQQKIAAELARKQAMDNYTMQMGVSNLGIKNDNRNTNLVEAVAKADANLSEYLQKSSTSDYISKLQSQFGIDGAQQIIDRNIQSLTATAQTLRQQLSAMNGGQGMGQSGAPNAPQMPQSAPQAQSPMPQSLIPNAISSVSGGQANVAPQVAPQAAPVVPQASATPTSSNTGMIKTKIGSGAKLMGRDEKGQLVYEDGGLWAATEQMNPQTGEMRNVFEKIPNSGADYMPEEKYQENLSAAQEFLADVEAMSSYAKIVEEYPEMFAWYVSGLDGIAKNTPLGNHHAGKWRDDIINDLNPDHQPPLTQVRSKILEKGAELIKKFYGAVLSLNESKLANQFIPTADNNPTQIVDRLSKIPAELKKLKASKGEAAVMQALIRANISPEEANEYFGVQPEATDE